MVRGRYARELKKINCVLVNKKYKNCVKIIGRLNVVNNRGRGSSVLKSEVKNSDKKRNIKI